MTRWDGDDDNKDDDDADYVIEDNDSGNAGRSGGGSIVVLVATITGRLIIVLAAYQLWMIYLWLCWRYVQLLCNFKFTTIKLYISNKKVFI